MFRVRWAKNVVKEDKYFTTMVIPEANKSKTTKATAQNEPWVMAKHVEQCFFIQELQIKEENAVRNVVEKLGQSVLWGPAQKVSLLRFDDCKGEYVRIENGEEMVEEIDRQVIRCKRIYNF